MLLHVSSLPAPFGIGDLGPAARRWVDTLAAAGQRWWQLLPLGPSTGGDAPYGCLSAFAGNALLISPEDLRAEGLLNGPDLDPGEYPPDRVPFERVVVAKVRMLDLAWTAFRAGRAAKLRSEFDAFRAAQSAWLEDFALFMALRRAFAGRSWIDWPPELVRRKTTALAEARRRHADLIEREQFLQFLFFRQWDALHDYAKKRGVGVIGDVPIFVAFDSVDVWTHPQLFKLDARHRPTVVAGVPPDYFSETGQRWGNPLYRWSAMRADHFAWWVNRVRATLARVDVLRIDHFRGFAACWEIPADAPTAVHGRWARAPGAELLSALTDALGGLPFIAEDLGVITTDVVELRDRFGLPGMRVLQFAFEGDWSDSFLPHQYVHNTVVYTATHDNDTAVGWYRSLSSADRKRLKRYVPTAGAASIGTELVRTAWSSVANLAIAPVQDILNLSGRARMNTPGTIEKNWRWRLKPDQWTNRTTAALRELTETYNRL